MIKSSFFSQVSSQISLIAAFFSSSQIWIFHLGATRSIFPDKAWRFIKRYLGSHSLSR
jgi:hypothetical protein